MADSNSHFEGPTTYNEGLCLLQLISQPMESLIISKTIEHNSDILERLIESADCSMCLEKKLASLIVDKIAFFRSINLRKRS